MLRVRHMIDGPDEDKLVQFFLDWIAVAETLRLNLGQDFTKERQALKYHLEDMRKLVFKGGPDAPSTEATPAV